MLRKPGEQRRPMASHPRLHHELILIDQSQLRQRERKLYASYEKPSTWLLLEPLNCLSQIAAQELCIPIDPVQRTRHDILFCSVDRLREGLHPRLHPIRSRSCLRCRPPCSLHHLVSHPPKNKSIGLGEVLRMVTVHLFVRSDATMIAAPV